MKKILPLLFLVPFLVAQAWAEDRLFVNSAKAKVMAEPDFRAPVIAELSRADEVQVLEQQGPWLRVNFGTGQPGWISRLVLAPAPPLERVTVLSGDEENSLRDVRRRTSAITTAAAARGLAASRRNDPDKGQHPSDYEAVSYMENIKPSATDLTRFAQALEAGSR